MKNQAGFSLVMAIFILVVLALLGSYMLKLSGIQLATSVYTIQGARAYQAARAGIEWSIARISDSGSCTDITSASPLSFTDMDGFSVTLECDNSISYSEGTDSYVVYKVVAWSQYGVYTSADYVSRRLEVSIFN